MTAEEHAHMQELEGLVKRYRSRIVELKEQRGRRIEAVRVAVEALDTLDPDKINHFDYHRDEAEAKVVTAARALVGPETPEEKP